MEIGTPTKSKSTLLAVVPDDIYADFSANKFLNSGRAKANAPLYSVELNVAVWLKFNEPIAESVGVWLLYNDLKGQKKVFVDKGTLNSSKHLMLSAKVEVKYRGGIDYMKVVCSSESLDAPNITLDELFVQPVKQKVTQFTGGTVSRFR